MFGIKMPWTRRKERLVKEAAAEQAERKARIERAIKELRKRDRLDAEWFAAKARCNPEPVRVPYIPTPPGYIRHDTVGGRTQFIATETVDTFPLVAAMQIATISTVDDSSGYCPPQSSASSYTPSYESPSCSSYSSSYDSSSSSSDSSSSSSSSYD